ncbi:winged helix-turn-helix transcriptional regulator [Kushneria phosphatilytica]|uniref:Helix-turn-helix transcriptional regulator n=1 Tax=Kushneria phosphatilytica TaxID=657387 RepID=A0A1S1NV16_9GAMM|nr:helix-turn-helix domain-containing protein [Kushneria phosphatilytica]OHV07607.1 hypothetical protein BH688_15475 [Kushneria phosphatilytica]QEL10095.1 helix-turn-helix transcriptional regulator [Kushneria phosphatilytica]
MTPTDLTAMPCPAARALGCVGEWWSLLILRDTLQGLRRFDELQQSLGIASNMLSRRLRRMLDEGLLEKRPYQSRPVRHEYIPTPKGEELYPVIVMLFAWGEKHMSDQGRQLCLIDRNSERELSPLVVDRHTLEPVTVANSTLAPGPQAGPAVLDRLARLRHADSLKDA